MAVYYKRDVNPTNTNWNQNDNWSTVSSTSSTNTGTYPNLAADSAIFDASSASVSVVTNITVGTLTMTGYNNTLTFNNAYVVTSVATTLPSGVSGALAVIGTGSLIINGTQTVTTNGKTIPALSYGSAGTKTFVGNCTVGTLSILNTGMVHSGAYTMTVSNLVMTNPISGTLTMQLGTTGTHSGASAITCPVTWSGNGSITVTGNLSYSSFDHTSFTGTFTIGSGVMPTIACNTGSHVVLNASATYASGGAGASLRFGGTVAYNMTSNGKVLPYDISTNTSNIRTLLDNWTLASGAQFTSLTSAGTFNGFKFIIKGQFNTAAGVSGTTVFEFQTGTTLAGGAGGSSAPFVFNGNVTWNGSVVVGNGMNWTYTSGTINCTGGTLSILSSNITLTGWGTNVQIPTITTTSSANPTTVNIANADLYCTNITGNSSCRIDFTSATYKVYISGSLPTANTVTLGGTAEMIMSGTGSISNISLIIVGKLTINTSGTITVGNFTLGAGAVLKYTAGTITGTGAATVTGNISLDISTISSRISFSSTSSCTVTLLSKMIANAINLLGAYSFFFTGAYDIDCNSIALNQNCTFGVPSGNKLTVNTSITIVATTSTIPSLLRFPASGAPMKLEYKGTMANCKIYFANLQYIDASLSVIPIYNWYSSNTVSCTNIFAVTGADIGSGSTSLTIF